ncbi:MAG: sigma-70 family RNA polymerase sigma factor [Burkholderiales bacterium]|nr:sigma-70 family RNA polymerase sigma factor [Phycisphaerae bacterium]
MSTPDDDLITLARSGHRPAFEMLVHRTSRLVWAHLILRTRDRALAEDLVQETYLRAWRSITSLNDSQTFRAWLLKVADNVRLDALKHASRRKRGAPARRIDENADPASSRPSPSEQAEQNDLQNRAIEAMGELPEQYQQALALRYLGGADYDEISRQLALTNGSLRGLLHRGLELLREKLKTDE